MRQFLTAAAIMLMASVTSAESLSQSCSQQGDSACIDWDRQLIIAEGIGVPSATAKSIAQKHAPFAVGRFPVILARRLLRWRRQIHLGRQRVPRRALWEPSCDRARWRHGRRHGRRHAMTRLARLQREIVPRAVRLVRRWVATPLAQPPC